MARVNCLVVFEWCVQLISTIKNIITGHHQIHHNISFMLRWCVQKTELHCSFGEHFFVLSLSFDYYALPCNFSNQPINFSLFLILSLIFWLIFFLLQITYESRFTSISSSFDLFFLLIFFIQSLIFLLIFFYLK